MCFLDINLEFPNNLYLLQSYTISLARSAAFYISQTQFECTKFITQRLLHEEHTSYLSGYLHNHNLKCENFTLENV